MACAYSGGRPRPELEARGRLAVPGSLHREDLQVFCMHGDNMAPQLRDGAHFGGLPDDVHVVSGRVYALFAPHEGHYRAPRFSGR